MHALCFFTNKCKVYIGLYFIKKERKKSKEKQTNYDYFHFITPLFKTNTLAD